MHLTHLQNNDLLKGIQEEKFVWKVFQDYQLTLVNTMKMQILQVTIINKLSKFAALVFQLEYRHTTTKDQCILFIFHFPINGSVSFWE